MFTYKNGNYFVSIDRNTGTKIRFTKEDEFYPAFPESIDLKLSSFCDRACPFCYENKTKDGKYADILSPSFLDTLHAGTELALDGIDHPDILRFLDKMKRQGVICNTTVRQDVFLEKQEELQWMISQGLLHGIGISLIFPTEELFAALDNFPTAVIHVIAGLLTEDQYKLMMYKNVKMLILGYKTTGKGKEYLATLGEEFKKNQSYLRAVLPFARERFSVVAFDNLALEQLKPEEWVDEETWDKGFLGDDGEFTCYVDLVKRILSKNSISPVSYPLPASAENFLVTIREEQD